MQTERVTFLTTPDHKAALDAFAASNGMSVGHVVREATSRYVVEGDMTEDDRFKLLIHELDEALATIGEVDATALRTGSTVIPPGARPAPPTAPRGTLQNKTAKLVAFARS